MKKAGETETYYFTSIKLTPPPARCLSILTIITLSPDLNPTSAQNVPKDF